MAKQIEVNPEARLESRRSDVRITLEQYLQISLFDQLKNKIKENKWPGAMVVRRYRKGEVVCRQGEPGWTAFYILTLGPAILQFVRVFLDVVADVK